MITGKRMGKKVMAALLAAALVCGMTGCGKAESASGEAAGGDAVDFSGLSGGGDSVDLSGASESDDTAALMGAPEEAGSEGRQAVDEDFVIVKVPQISYDDFGNGFYDGYEVDYEPLVERTYDEDGLLTGARLYFEDMVDPKDARISLSYEKNEGMVTACEISADMYAWYACREDSLYWREDEAQERNHDQQRKMPYRLEFHEPIAADPDVVKEAIITKIGETEEELYQAILPPTLALDFYEAFSTMYLDSFNALGGTKQEAGLHVTCDEDGLLTAVKIGYEAEEGGTAESWMTVQYEREGGQITACEINADLYSFFVNDVDSDEESAKERNEALMAQMPVRITFDEPVDPEPDMVAEWILMNLETLDHDRQSAGEEDEIYMFIMLIYGEGYAGVEQDTASEVDIGGRIQDRFRERMSGNELAVNYFGGGELTGEKRISNDPGWSGDMSVSHEDVICQIETEQDSDGNLTLVHLYNDYASYDYVYTYDSAGRMTRSDYYEYPKGQSREAVGARWYTEYSYDGEGRLVKKYEMSNQDNGVESATEYYYDDMGRVAARIDSARYFGNDFMTMQQIYDSVTQSYEYDDSGKVILVSVTVDWAQTTAHMEPLEPTTVLYIAE